MTMIYKIFRSDEYADFVAKGQTLGAPIDIADGFVHFSTAEQAAETAAKHFAEETGLKLLAINGAACGDALKWEESRGGALFPHLYRPLTAKDVIWARDLPYKDGHHQFEEALT